MKAIIGRYRYKHDDKHTKCVGIRSSLRYLERISGRKGMSRLVSILNKCVGREFFTRDHLYDDGTWISYEIYQTINEIAKRITDDPRFCHSVGRSFFELNQGGLVTIGKYLGSPELVYREFPGFINRYNNQIQMSFIRCSPTKAIMRSTLRRPFRQRFGRSSVLYKNGCDLCKGIFSSIPTLFDLPPAEVIDIACMGEGDRSCEWHIVWKRTGLARRLWNAIIARDYKVLMEEQNQELSRTIAKLEQKVEELQQKNSEITRYQQELIEKEKLQSALTLLSELAHDLKTPLTMISGYAQLSQACELSREDMQSNSSMILLQSERTLSIIQDLLDHLSGKPPLLSIQQVDAGRFLSDLHSELSPGYEASGICTALDIQDSCMVDIDPSSMRRAIFNICKNAREAMADKGILTLGLDATDSHAIMICSDTGPGIPAHLRSQVFRRFVSDKKGGTGLGMAIAKGIVEAHGGDIKLDTGVRGTRIIIRIPRSASLPS